VSGFLPNVWHRDVLAHLRAQPTIAIPWAGEKGRYTYKALGDERYRRKVERVVETPPTAEELAAYAEAEAAWAILEHSPYFDGGGPEYGPELTPPQPKCEYVYAETEEAWIERCRTIDAEG
jgi:hypothetical protein